MAVLAAIATNIPAIVPAASAGDRSQRSRAWDDKKVTTHHAIIPTLVAKPIADLTPAERAIYDLIARRYLAQFLPAFEYHETKIELSIEGERFRATGRQTIAGGWRALVPTVQSDEERKDSEDEDDTVVLPLLREGEQIACVEVAIAGRHTAPPKRFTEASLIQAMTGIARYVQDPKIKQLLRETDGIGTPATQAAIIQTLFDRGFIERRRRQVVATPIGRALTEVLPEVATRPDMTALWEAAMRRIADGQMPLAQFLTGVLEQLQKLVDAGRSRGALAVPGVRSCPAPGCTGALRSRKGQHGSFWSCSRYPECRFTESALKDSPNRPSRGQRLRPASSGQTTRPKAAHDPRSTPYRYTKPISEP